MVAPRSRGAPPRSRPTEISAAEAVTKHQSVRPVEGRNERHLPIREEDADDEPQSGLDQRVREIGDAAIRPRRVGPLELAVRGEKRLAFVVAVRKGERPRAGQRDLSIAVREKRRAQRHVLRPVEAVIRLPRVADGFFEVRHLLARP